MKCVISIDFFNKKPKWQCATILLIHTLNRWPSTNWYGMEWQEIIPSIVVSWLGLKPRQFFPNPLSSLPLNVSIKGNTSLLTSFWRRGKSFFSVFPFSCVNTLQTSIQMHARQFRILPTFSSTHDQFISKWLWIFSCLLSISTLAYCSGDLG
jgi:hypothetical protein